MESKKNPGASLEKKRFWFLQMGLVVSCSIVLISFEWRQPVEITELCYGKSKPINMLEVEIAPLHKPEVPKVEKQQAPLELDMPIEIVDELKLDLIDLDLPKEISDDPQIVDIGDIVEATGAGAEEPLEFLPYADMPYLPDCYSNNKEEQKNCTDIKIQEILRENMSYPDMCRREGIQGTVLISFVINTDGKITNIKLERGVHPLMDKEAMDAVKALPEFVAGNQRGRKVPVLYKMPLNFKLKN